MIERRGDWLSAMVGDELMMMSVENGRYLGLSDVGARIWEMLERPREMDDLCAGLRAEFAVDAETCRSEVQTFVKAMVDNGALTITDS